MAEPDTKRIHVDEEAATPRPERRPMTVTIVVGTAVVISLLAVLPSLLNDELQQPGVIASPTTAAPTTTTVPETIPPTTEPAGPEPGTMMAETGLGTFMWTRISGAASDLPVGRIMWDPVEESYAVFEPPDIWRSETALTWALDESPNPFGENAWVWINGEYAFVDAAFTGTRLFRALEATWVQIDLSGISDPDIAGLEWDIWPGLPATLEERTVIPVQRGGHIPWEDFYPSENVPCPESPNGCPVPPWASWNSFAGQLILHSPMTDETIATLNMVQEGRLVIITDAETTEPVTEIVFPTGEDAEAYITNLAYDTYAHSPGTLIEQDDGSFAFMDVPWTEYTSVVPIPEGLLSLHDSGEPSQRKLRLWVSRDGIVWEEVAVPIFLAEPYQWTNLQTWSGGVLLTVTRQGNGDEPPELWHTTDGLEWVRDDVPFDQEVYIQETGLGLVAHGWGEDLTFWISADGREWNEIPAPATRLGRVDFGSAGDLVYVIDEAAAVRTLWIGRFVDDPVSQSTGH